jgi:hypothetical protein
MSGSIDWKVGEVVRWREMGTGRGRPNSLRTSIRLTCGRPSTDITFIVLPILVQAPQIEEPCTIPPQLLNRATPPIWRGMHLAAQIAAHALLRTLCRSLHRTDVPHIQAHSN